VVTEHGIARLQGRTVRERTRERIGVANPVFRDELTSRARVPGYLWRFARSALRLIHPNHHA
jgi:acyl-CoA hydrolase